jgi:TRAP-type C4-dicarboxylate transport system permease small subunit
MFRKAVDALSAALEWIAIGCFTGAVGLVIVAVSLRPLQIASPWSDEGACWLFIWTIFLSAAVALKRNLHIRIDVVLLHLPPKWRGGLLFVLNILCLIFCIGLLYGISQMFQASYHMTSPALEIPMAFYYLPLFIGFAMMVVYLAIFIWDFILGKQTKAEGS